jgi:hypothetical protein
MVTVLVRQVLEDGFIVGRMLDPGAATTEVGKSGFLLIVAFSWCFAGGTGVIALEAMGPAVVIHMCGWLWLSWLPILL